MKDEIGSHSPDALLSSVSFLLSCVQSDAGILARSSTGRGCCPFKAEDGVRLPDELIASQLRGEGRKVKVERDTVGADPRVVSLSSVSSLLSRVASNEIDADSHHRGEG